MDWNAKTKTVFTVVLNYRTAPLTVNAVRSVLASCLHSHDLHVIVVDNGSGADDLETLQRDLDLPEVDIFANDSNTGYAGGNNVGIRSALRHVDDAERLDGYIVLLLNSDVTVDSYSLQKCLDYLEMHPDVGVVGPKVLLPDGRLDLACRRSFPTPSSGFWKLTGLARLFPDSPRFAQYNLTYLDPDKTYEVDSVTGAFMLLRMEAIQQAGLLDERFFMYGEDLDWAYRIKAHGWKVVYYPEAQVIHLKGETTRRQSERLIIEFYRSMWLFHRKHYAWRTLFLLNWLIMMGIILRGCVAFCRNLMRQTEHRRVS